MSSEIADMLTAYLMDWNSLRDCAEWIAGIDWDDPALTREFRYRAGRLELLSTETLEGLRPEADFWKEAAEYVAHETGSVYWQPNPGGTRTTAGSSNVSTGPVTLSEAGVGAS